ncbi:alpha/beta hydrolase [Candidatus Saccharibacteria bacterium]|nr:alpha/beta hydrolase [Candidatus Saccharibacteria bacterium]
MGVRGASHNPRQAVILHGTDGTPTGIVWQGNLKKYFEKNGYQVYFPQLPGCHTPNVALYDEFLQQSGWDFTDNIIVGHSSGATTLLHLLGQDWFPRVRAAVLVGTFLNEAKLQGVSWYEPGQFDGLFVEAFDPKKIAQKAAAFYFVHGNDDPYCDYNEAHELCKTLDGTFISIPGGGHLSASGMKADLTELTDILTRDEVL